MKSLATSTCNLDAETSVSGTIQGLTPLLLLQVAKLASLEEFQKQKEQLTSNMESLEKQLVSQEEEHKAAIHSLDMKALLEKKRLRQLIYKHHYI